MREPRTEREKGRRMGREKRVENFQRTSVRSPGFFSAGRKEDAEDERKSNSQRGAEGKGE